MGLLSAILYLRVIYDAADGVLRGAAGATLKVSVIALLSPPRRCPLVDTSRYEPHLDGSGTKEDVAQYIARMQSTILPNWPDDPLHRWLWENSRGDCLSRYAWLGFENFEFTRERMRAEDIPGRECFYEGKVCVSCSKKVTVPAYRDKGDWLLQYMLEHGTWPHPAILLYHPDRYYLKAPWGKRLSRPWHLLEGHRRLSFLTGLKKIGKAQPEHDVWVVRLSKNPMKSPEYKQALLEHVVGQAKESLEAVRPLLEEFRRAEEAKKADDAAFTASLQGKSREELEAMLKELEEEEQRRSR